MEKANQGEENYHKQPIRAEIKYKRTIWNLACVAGGFVCALKRWTVKVLLGLGTEYPICKFIAH